MTGTMTTPAHLAATQMFIDQNPVTINPVRVARVATGTGGFTDGAETTLPAITCRKVGQNQKSAVIERTTVDGQLVIPNGVFVCMPDVNLQRGDTFQFEGHEAEVLFVSKLPPWRLQAEVYHHG